MRRTLSLLLLTACVVVSAKETSLIRNGGFENLDDHDYPRHWVSAQHAGVRAYEFRADAREPHAGEHSMRMHRTQPQVWGITEQIIDCRPHIGRTLEFSLALRAAAVDGRGARVYLGAYAESMLLDEARTEPLRGDFDWQSYTLVLTIPEKCTDLRVGVSLNGGGTVWMDSARLVARKPDRGQ
jgi:hypothetical protein